MYDHCMTPQALKLELVDVISGNNPPESLHAVMRRWQDLERKKSQTLYLPWRTCKMPSKGMLMGHFCPGKGHLLFAKRAAIWWLMQAQCMVRIVMLIIN